jgi:hypothetical protein
MATASRSRGSPPRSCAARLATAQGDVGAMLRSGRALVDIPAAWRAVRTGTPQRWWMGHVFVDVFVDQFPDEIARSRLVVGDRAS